MGGLRGDVQVWNRKGLKDISHLHILSINEELQLPLAFRRTLYINVSVRVRTIQGGTDEGTEPETCWFQDSAAFSGEPGDRS